MTDKRTLWPVTGLALAAMLAGCAHGEDAKKEQQAALMERGPRAVEVAFGRLPEQRLDIYQPDDPVEGPRPALLLVHGGAWMMGDKRDLIQVGQKYASQGYVVFSINYRLVRGAKNRWPACWDDTHKALQWVIANAGEYDVDPGRVGAMGFSAGGHLVSLLGTRPETRKKVACVVDYFGPADMRPFEKGMRGSRLLIGGPLMTDERVYDEASPVVQASSESPPFLILHGDKDRLVPLVQSERFFKVLKDKGVDVTLKVYPGQKHAFCRVKAGEPNPAAEDSWARATAFLKKHLRPR